MASKIPLTQRAWVFRKIGSPSAVLKLEEAYSTPVPKKGEILIRVRAAALNPVGWKGMSMPPLSYLHTTPATPESDFSGEVAGGHLEGTGFALGDEVFGITPADTVMKNGRGTLAQYTVALPGGLAHKPANISHADAAAFPLAGLTAYYALVTVGGLKKGDGKRVFINGGSGGTGAWAIQIAKAYGAYVVTTCSPATRSFVSSLGPDDLIDYHSVPLSAHLSTTYASTPFDLIFDTVGIAELYHASPKFLKPQGKCLDIAGAAHITGLWSMVKVIGGLVNKLVRPRILGGTPREYKFLMLPAGKLTKELREAAEYLKDGTFKSVVDEEPYAFENALKAYEKQMSGRTKGKVVVNVP